MSDVLRPNILQENSIWQYAQLKDRFANASFSPNEFCMKRIFMPEGFIDESKIQDDYAPKTEPSVNP